MQSPRALSEALKEKEGDTWNGRQGQGRGSSGQLCQLGEALGFHSQPWEAAKGFEEGSDIELPLCVNPIKLTCR